MTQKVLHGDCSNDLSIFVTLHEFWTSAWIESMDSLLCQHRCSRPRSQKTWGVWVRFFNSLFYGWYGGYGWNISWSLPARPWSRAANSHLATREWHRIAVHHRAAVHGHEEVPRINRLGVREVFSKWCWEAGKYPQRIWWAIASIVSQFDTYVPGSDTKPSTSIRIAIRIAIRIGLAANQLTLQQSLPTSLTSGLYIYLCRPGFLLAA